MDQIKFLPDDPSLKVKPCCCCQMQYRAFFKTFSIAMVVCMSIATIGLGFSVFEVPSFGTIYSPSTDLIIVILLLFIYYKSRKNGEYGTKFAYSFSLFCLIITVIELSLLVVGGIILIFTRLKSFTSFNDMSPMMFFAIVYCVVVPLSVYKMYLFYLYFVVIKTRLGAVETHVYLELMSRDSSKKLIKS